jgi:hypothetical protein
MRKWACISILQRGIAPITQHSVTRCAGSRHCIGITQGSRTRPDGLHAVARCAGSRLRGGSDAARVRLMIELSKVA